MTSSPNSAPGMRMAWHGRTVVGCVRTNNEDNLLAAPITAGDRSEGDSAGETSLERPGMLLAVADGMGGAKAGEVASGMAVTILGDEMANRLSDDFPADEARAQIFVEAVEVANERIRDEGANNPNRKGMGTTLTALWVHDDTAEIAHVGDSRAYLFRAGHLSQLTKDQSLVEKLLEDNIITEEEAERMAARNIILQALGSEEDLEVVHQQEKLEAGDTVVLCTDGLSGVVSNEDLEEALQKGGDLETICQRLIKLAEERGGPDNITVLMAKLQAEG